MILPSSDISIMDVRNATGCPSTDLGTLVAKAKEGGTGGYAFQINENGSWGSKLGFKIDDAFPYWNIWSSNSPGHFEIWLDGSMIYRLKNNPQDSINAYYRFALGDFRNYNTDAPAPSVKCTNAVDDILYYYPSVQRMRLVFTAYCSEIDWTEFLTVNHFYIRIVGITSGNLEEEIAFLESPSYVNVDGSSYSFNMQYELNTTRVSQHTKMRFELWVGYLDSSGQVINRSKIPFIEDHIVQVARMQEGVKAGNILWFYIYNPNGQVENIAIPDMNNKISVSNKDIEFIYETQTPSTGYYQYQFEASIVGDNWITISNVGDVNLSANYDVLLQGAVYKQDGTTQIVDYQKIGTIFLDSYAQNNKFQINIPTSICNNRYDTGTLHLFLRQKSS